MTPALRRSDIIFLQAQFTILFRGNSIPKFFTQFSTDSLILQQRRLGGNTPSFIAVRTMKPNEYEEPYLRTLLYLILFPITVSI